MVDWEYLIITAKERPTPAAVSNPENSVRKQKLVVAEDSCSICFQDFHKTPASANHTTACGHTFHADCVGVWKASGGTSCPICRENIEDDDEVKA